LDALTVVYVEEKSDQHLQPAAIMSFEAALLTATASPGTALMHDINAVTFGLPHTVCIVGIAGAICATTLTSLGSVDALRVA
jgi:hypothetical protein